MVDKERLYSALNEGVLDERLNAFTRNLAKNRELIKKYGGLLGTLGDFKGKTVIVIGAGPSLEKNLDILRSYQYREGIVYISTDMALRPLVKRGIRPRYVISCETSPVDFFGGLDTSGMHLLAFSCMSHSNLLRWRGDVHFYNWMIDRPEYRRLWEAAGTDLGFVATGGLVTTQAVAFALGCGTSGLALAGNDLGFYEGYYTRESIPCRNVRAASYRLYPPETGEMARSRRAREYLIKRGERSFYTTGQFLAGKMWLEELFKKQGRPVYDCSDPGCSEKYVAKMDLSDLMQSIYGKNKKRRR